MINELPAAPTITTWFIIGTSLVWFFYEIYTLIYNKQTISAGMYYLAKRPIVPFVMGLLAGHWFW